MKRNFKPSNTLWVIAFFVGILFAPAVARAVVIVPDFDPPNLSFPTSDGYITDGVNPNLSFPATPAVLKVVYKDIYNDEPLYMNVVIDGDSYLMIMNPYGGQCRPGYNNGVPTTQCDYYLGMEYIFTPSTTLASGSHTYHFETKNTYSGLTARLPVSGELSFEVKKNDPVIIVPGIGACLNSTMLSDSISAELLSPVWGLIGDYQNLIKTFEAIGYEQGKDLFVGCYDWRKTNGLNPDDAMNSGEEYLRDWISKAKEKTGASKVDIIAHSMGGLVARSYIQGDNYGNDVDQFIMLGTPNYGAVDTYYAWEGGEIPQSWADFKIPVIVYLNLLKYQGKDITNVATIHEFMPSVKQLLPTFDYLLDSSTNELISNSTMKEQNDWLLNLNDENEIWKLNSRVRTKIIYGDGINTLNEIPVESRGIFDSLLGKWEDGKPVDGQAHSQFTGDGTVNVGSALLPDVETEQLVGARHGVLPSTAIGKILETLGLPTDQIINLPGIKNHLTFFVASPVFPIVTAPDGIGQIGYDATTGNVVNTIEGGQYFSAGDGEAKLIIIPNPTDGKYTLELTGNADGEYHLSTGYFSDNQTVTKETVGAVLDEQVISYPINLQTNATTSADVLPELAPEEGYENATVSSTIAVIDSMTVKNWIKGQVSAQQLIRPLVRLNTQLASINEREARLRGRITIINANPKIKPAKKIMITQNLNRRITALLSMWRAQATDRILITFKNNLENLKKKSKITVEGYNALIKIFNNLKKSL